MAKISDVVKLKSGYAHFVELKSAFEAAQENADRMAMYRPTKAHRMAFPVALEIPQVLFKPGAEPGIVILVVVRISLAPASVIVCFQGSFAGGSSTGLLTFANSWIWSEASLAVGALFHPDPPFAQEESNNPNQPKNQDEGIEIKRKEPYIFVFLSIIGIKRKLLETG